jgi:uncharacterized protein (DUF58 family)
VNRFARSYRLLTLFAPSLIAGLAVLAAGDEREGGFRMADAGSLTHAASQVLVPLFLVMAGALAIRLIEATILGQKRRAGTLLDQLDILTATGRAILWSGSAAIAASLYTGWASLAVLGILGLGVVYVAVTWTSLVAGGDEPWRGAAIDRAILPAVATEGDPVREEIRLRNVKIPAGFRLFVNGWSRRHGPNSRYAVSSEGSRAELLLESDLGAAVRGEHTAPPLQLWLGDVLGLTRTPIARFGAAAQTVLPKPGQVEGARLLLGKGRDDTTTVPTRRLPTEGLFRLREYAPGDDTRRIHWVRSLNANQLVVRLPDEIPPAEPAVRLILDTHLVGTETLACRAPDELLDALVRVWLGVGRALSDTGARVTLVAATTKGDGLVATERPLSARIPKEALRLGAKAAWQPSMPLKTLLKSGTERQVVVSSRPRPTEAEEGVVWVVVPEVVWTTPDPWPDERSVLQLPHPIGAAENRWGRRAAARRRAAEARRDGAIFNELLCWTDWRQLRGAFVARPKGARIALEVVS